MHPKCHIDNSSGCYGNLLFVGLQYSWIQNAVHKCCSGGFQHQSWWLYSKADIMNWEISERLMSLRLLLEVPHYYLVMRQLEVLSKWWKGRKKWQLIKVTMVTKSNHSSYMLWPIAAEYVFKATKLKWRIKATFAFVFIAPNWALVINQINCFIKDVPKTFSKLFYKPQYSSLFCITLPTVHNNKQHFRSLHVYFFQAKK